MSIPIRKGTAVWLTDATTTFIMAAAGCRKHANAARFTIRNLGILLGVLMLVGCESVPNRQATPVMSSSEYQARPPLEASLFSSDQAVLGDDAIKRILTSKVELPEKAKVAVMKFSIGDPGASRYYGYYYWRQEEYIKTQQEFSDTLASGLLASKRLAEVTPMPTLMVPKQASIPLLREAAVRMQADLLVVYRITSDTYYKTQMFAKDKVKSYSTCEVVVLDIRTGLVPFTRVVTREKEAKKEANDLDVNETGRRAEKAAALESLKAVTDDFVSFLDSLPPKGG